MVSVDDLEQFPIFSGLDHALLINIAEICSTHTYHAGEVCVTEGAVAQNFYLLLSGEIALERRLPEQLFFYAEGIDRDAVVYTLKAKQAFGWSALVEPGRHTATARCSENCDVIMISGKDLMDVFDRSEQASYHFMKRLTTVIALRLIDTSNHLLREMADFATYRSM